LGRRSPVRCIEPCSELWSHEGVIMLLHPEDVIGKTADLERSLERYFVAPDRRSGRTPDPMLRSALRLNRFR
jgi:hypothetical protein